MAFSDTLFGTTQYNPYQVDPGLIAQQQALATQATDFQSNLPSYENQLQNQAQNSIQSNIANQMADVKYKANQRGLLYGGQRQGAQGAVQGNAANELANQTQNINQNSMNMANQFSNQAVKSGLQAQNASNLTNYGNYQQAMQNWMQKRQAISGLVNGGAQGVGAIASLL